MITIKNKKRQKLSKTIKNKKINTKKQFVKDIIKEWKKQTKGDVTKDLKDNYLNDYYFSFTKDNDYNNHIHLVLHNFIKNKSSYNNFLYIMKKCDKQNKKIIHSNEFKISFFLEPKIVVQNMIHNYNKFAKTN